MFKRNLVCSVVGIAVACIASTGWAATNADREEVSKYIQSGDFASADKIFASLQPSPPNIKDGSIYFEELEACGFYPQESRLECIIPVKQRFGYGGPVGSPGSHEHVLFCVDWDQNGWFTQNEMTGSGMVHVHDEWGAAAPPWRYAVYRDIDPIGGPRTSNGGGVTNTTTSGPTYKARAVLSWYAAVPNCNATPIWGNVRDFQIRLDPIR